MSQILKWSHKQINMWIYLASQISQFWVRNSKEIKPLATSRRKSKSSATIKSKQLERREKFKFKEISLMLLKICWSKKNFCLKMLKNIKSLAEIKLLSFWIRARMKNSEVRALLEKLSIESKNWRKNQDYLPRMMSSSSTTSTKMLQISKMPLRLNSKLSRTQWKSQCSPLIKKLIFSMSVLMPARSMEKNMKFSSQGHIC